jgi:hypothetical protein
MSRYHHLHDTCLIVKYPCLPKKLIRVVTDGSICAKPAAAEMLTTNRSPSGGPRWSYICVCKIIGQNSPNSSHKSGNLRLYGGVGIVFRTIALHAQPFSFPLSDSLFSSFHNFPFAFSVSTPYIPEISASSSFAVPFLRNLHSYVSIFLLSLNSNT